METMWDMEMQKTVSHPVTGDLAFCQDYKMVCSIYK